MIKCLIFKYHDGCVVLPDGSIMRRASFGLMYDQQIEHGQVIEVVLEHLNKVRLDINILGITEVQPSFESWVIIKVWYQDSI